MPWGLIFFGVAAILLLLRKNIDIPISRFICLALLLATLLLTFIHIPIENIYLNVGSLFMLIACMLLIFIPARAGLWRRLLGILIFGAAVFVQQTDMLWQIAEYVPAHLPLMLPFAIIAALATGNYYDAVITAGAGTQLAALAGLLFFDMEMNIEYLNICGQILSRVWLWLWIIGVFHHRRLTNRS